MSPLRALTLSALAAALVGLAQAQVVTYVWTGNARTFSGGYAQASSSTGGNWQGDTAPTSSVTATVLDFGASAGINANQSLYVAIPYGFGAAGLRFGQALPYYVFSVDDNGPLRLGAEGIEIASTLTSDEIHFAYGKVELGTTQTWDTAAATLKLSGRITEASPGYALTKTGSGALQLWNNESTFSGGLVVQGGSLVINGSSTYDDITSTITRGPLGTGPLTLASGTSLLIQPTQDVALHNPVNVGASVTIGSAWQWHDADLVLHGPVTPTGTTTTIRLTPNATVFFKGALGTGTNGDSNITFTSTEAEDHWTMDEGSGRGLPVAVLSGNNVGLGNVTVTEAGVVFLTNASIPNAPKTISANNGYVGVGQQGGMETVLARIADRAAFNGALGFDTDPDASSTPTTFNDTVNLTGFTNDSGSATSGFWGLGSLTRATLTGPITPPTGGNYVFGGGDGTLYVASDLTAATGVRVRTPTDDDPLTVWLQGNNSFTGKLLSDHSLVVLDSANALPATGANPDTGRFQMDSGAYVGYTEATGWTPAQFIARFVPTGDHSRSVLGFDSANASGRTIADPIDLSSFSDVFVGTSTHVHLTGTITAPRADDAAGRLSVAGVKGGWLTIDGPLQAANVASVLVGLTETEALANGIVELANATSDYTGSTSFQSGYLVLGASSTSVSNTVTAGPLGTGTLAIDNVSWSSKPTLVAGQASVTLHNAISLGSGTTARFGAPVTTDKDDAASQFPIGYGTNHLTLAGSLSGNPGSLYFSGNGKVTLAGNNSGLTANYVSIGDEEGSGRPLVVAATDTAFGTGATAHLYLLNGSDLQFTSANPTIGGLGGGYLDGTNASYIDLAPDSRLTINQQQDNWLWATIGGTPADFGASTSAPATSASVVKSGPGTLTLASANTYTGGTTIKAGTLVAAQAGALGSGAVTLDGGRLSLAAGLTLSNALTFGDAGGTLTGTGAFGVAVAVGDKVVLSPGASPGTLTFGAGLTFASDGRYVFEVQSDSSGTGYLTDLAVVTGTLTIASTNTARFIVSLRSLDAAGAAGALAQWDNSLSQSWTLASATTTIVDFAPDKFTLDVSSFASPLGGGSFALLQSGNALVLNFTPVPEPSTYALLALGLGFVVWQVRRRRSRT